MLIGTPNNCNGHIASALAPLCMVLCCIITANSVAGNGFNVSYNLGKNIYSTDIANPLQEGRIDLVIHVDTCVLGSHFQLFEGNGESCTVYPYYRDYEPVTLPIVHGWATYQHPDEINYVIALYNGLHMLSQEPSLIFSKQLRFNGISVHYCARRLSLVGEYLHCLSVCLSVCRSGHRGP